MKKILILGTIFMLTATLGCQNGGNRVIYSEVKTEIGGDGAYAPGTDGDRLVLEASAGSWRAGEMSSGRKGELGAVLFDLGSIPKGRAISRAVLRVRRRLSRGVPAVSAFAVDKGLQVLFFADGDPLFGITRARLTLDKEKMFEPATRVMHMEEQDGLKESRVCGMALTRYPVEVSLPAVAYRVKAFVPGARYGDLLGRWNTSARSSGKLAGYWDEFEVTAAAGKALAAEDRKLLVVLKVSGGEVSWYGKNSSMSWAGPRLVIETTAGSAIAATPAPQPQPTETVTPPVTTEEPVVVATPTPTPEPVSRPEPSPLSRPSQARGKLVISSEPSRADIYVDDRYVGTTPSRELVLPLGDVKVRLEKKGYLKWERVVSLLEGNVVSVAPELEEDEDAEDEDADDENAVEDQEDSVRD